LRWDGKSWTQVNAPDVGNPYAGYSQIEATPAGDIWATTYYLPQENGSWKTLLSHWNGKEWNAVPTPDFKLGQTVLAISSQDVWLAGASNEKAFIARYTGSACPGP